MTAQDTEDRRVVQTIARQIGDRAFQMMGTNSKMYDGPALIFNVRARNEKGVNKIKVHYDRGVDTYTVTFWKIGRAPRFDVTVVKEIGGVYADGLHQVIEMTTGLRLSL